KIELNQQLAFMQQELHKVTQEIRELHAAKSGALQQAIHARELKIQELITLGKNVQEALVVAREELGKIQEKKDALIKHYQNLLGIELFLAAQEKQFEKRKSS